MELFKKIYIKSEDDLPKEKGFYFVHYKHPDERLHTQMSVVYYDETIKGLWFGRDWYDWYLQPIESDEIQTPIEDGLYATGRFTQDECSELAEGLMRYIGESVRTDTK